MNKPPVTLYGIANCDTVKKARGWLDARGIEQVFYDYKKTGVDAAALDRWADARGWQALLNRAGTTFRKLDAADKADLDRARAVGLMIAHPSLIRRPVVERDGMLLIGFKPDEWAAAFG